MYDLLAAKKNAADSEDNPETISWQALGNETENVLGQRIDDANKFGILYDANPAFKELCSFGPEGVKLNTSSAEEAVHVAKRFAAKGDVVLLSPACASFDLFANYEDRGWQFKAAVKNL